MKNFFLSILVGLGVLLGVAQGYTIHVKSGWQLKGAMEDINATIFNSTNIVSVWIYDEDSGSWKVYLPNDPELMKKLPDNIKKLDSINQEAGFWVYAKNQADIDSLPSSSTQSVFSVGGLQTGQITSYEDFDDGYYKKGLAKKYTRDNEKGVVVESSTKLMWQDNSDANTVTKSWSDAIKYCEDLTLGGYDDWRLPSIDELLSLVDYEKYDLAIDQIFQNVTQNIYWSSTPSSRDDVSSWVIMFKSGMDAFSDKTSVFDVVCVRDDK